MVGFQAGILLGMIRFLVENLSLMMDFSVYKLLSVFGPQFTKWGLKM